jgi:carboxypeptidase Taq
MDPTPMATETHSSGELSSATKTKIQPTLDEQSIEFLKRCPFALISTVSADGTIEVSPKGDEPGFIRVEADELTYDFHIMLRVDIETRLIDGSLKVKDLPEAWNAVIKQELGLDVPSDRLGCLQDIHWSSGQIGTFCNYTIGNVMAAQVLETARAQDPSIQASVDAGDYAPLKDWLTRNIYVHGRRFARDELLTRITGRTLDAKPYVKYLRDKYSALYGVTI